MIFTERLKQSNQLCQFSPNGRYVAYIINQNLHVRDVLQLQLMHNLSCPDSAQILQWSPDSQFILVGSIKKSLVQVYSVENPTWKCKINEGTSGLVNSYWAPDSRHILNISELKLRVTIWSLVAKTVLYVRCTKNIEQPVVFSQDGKYMAVAERRENRDHISILMCDTWNLIKNFSPDTLDLSGISWSPESTLFCLWDSLLQYQLMIYTIDGHCLMAYRPAQSLLGIKTVTWSLSGQFLAVGSYDQRVRIFNYITWSPIADHVHSSKSLSKQMLIFKEVVQTNKDAQPLVLPNQTPANTKYDLIDDYKKIVLPTIKVDKLKTNPKIGVAVAKFSTDSRYLATINENMPNVVWIWSIEKMNLLTLLIQMQPVQDINWEPLNSRLAICSGTNKIFLWSLDGAAVAAVPTVADQMDIQQVRWHPTGNILLFMSKDRLCLCHCNELPLILTASII